ncbi:MAG TPA: C40 family peptidase [Flavisolibacter sp.]|jgi:cell wall-associated NlpC family hydrolase|nr:C40 family peptidase [Flavisolibacter sp.]
MKITPVYILLSVLISSCILVIDKRHPASGSLTSTDSSRAFGSKKDTERLNIPLDTSISAKGPINLIDTRSVHPSQVVEFAKTLIGIPYKYGSTDPKSGFDCSGFITYTFGHFGILVPRSSIDFISVGKDITINNSKRGDLILFTGTDSTERFAGHIGLVVSNDSGKVAFIHSTSGKQHGVTITDFNDYYRSRYLKAIRVFRENE